MAIFKCKMCGGDLEIGSNETVAVCEYCNTKQTIPALDNEKKINLFNRANRLRFNNEFDKAAGVYESIAAEFPEEAEAYWGLCLCKYGIEYIDDPKTGNKVPTCHRTSFDEIFSDNNFSLALEYADFTATSVYREEAKEINRLQKAILDIAKNEEPFDIFICYKETAEDGQRTKDSVLAQDMYDKLTEKGYKVFFSRITLEDKLGKEYEPYIFSALNSAKVMLAVGTKYEYYNAVWVKNEWSRFLDMMKSDKEKVLIPCYADIDAYDMPQEFKNLQGQDMGKIGFMQDLLRGIGKILGENAPQQTIIRETVVSSANSDTVPLLKRAFMFLEDGDFKSAEEYCEKVLDINPECAEAYLGKLMAELKVREKIELSNLDKSFDSNTYYQKIMRFGDGDLKNELSGYIEEINDRIEKNRIERVYKGAIDMMRMNTESSYKEAKKNFESINGYKDSTELIEKCKTKIAEIKEAEKIEEAKRQEEEKRRIEQLRIERENRERKSKTIACILAIIAVVIIAVIILLTSVVIPSVKYNNALELMQNGNYEEAISVFTEVKGYKDSIKHIEASKKNMKYEEAISLIESDPSAAAEMFEELGNFKDSQDKCKEAIYNQALSFMDAGQYEDAMQNFEKLGLDYKDSQTKYDEAKLGVYNQAIEFIDDENYSQAMKMFEKLGFDYKDSQEKYDYAKELQKEKILNSMNKRTISAGEFHTVGLKSNGTVVATGSSSEGKCDVSGWGNIVSVSAGNSHTIGLKSDGTVVATGYEGDGLCDVSGWRNIVAVSAGAFHTVGLKSDGTVVATGHNKYGQCDVSGWTDIVAVSAGRYHTVGLKSDGTIVATRDNDYGQCNVSGWTDIVAISTSEYHTIGLKSDGTVVAVGGNYYGECNVSSWTDVVAVSAGLDHTVGLKSDGTVVATGGNDFGECDVSDWTDIVAIATGDHYTVGLKSDGSVVAVGRKDMKQCNVSDWTDIKVY